MSGESKGGVHGGRLALTLQDEATIDTVGQPCLLTSSARLGGRQTTTVLHSYLHIADLIYSALF